MKSMVIYLNILMIILELYVQKEMSVLSDRIMYFTNIYNNITGSRTLHSIETQLIVP